VSNDKAAPLEGVQVVEICGEASVYAGKLLADAGADVILVEPPGGHAIRRYAPFVDDIPHPDRSLYFWNYNTSKRSLILDLDDAQARASFMRLAARADVVVESEKPERLASLGLDYPDLRRLNPGLIMASITPFGRKAPSAHVESTDLTLMAGGGMAWNSGYDDHTLPPTRAGGNQAYQTGCHFAVMAVLAALLHRDAGGPGQHIDVSLHAAANVTTEAGTYFWHVARQTVQRQTGRHAAVNKSQPVQLRCADGRYIASGPGLRSPRHYGVLYDWLVSEGLAGEFADAELVREGTTLANAAFGGEADPRQAKIAYAAREAMTFLASRLDAYDFFAKAQARDFQCAIIYTPDEVIRDPHFLARGFPTEVEHPELGRTVTYPGVPYKLHGSPARLSRRPPLVGEHTDEILAELALDGA
jgi:benzylsuccinate CoA-transferase BbsE subunit